MYVVIIVGPAAPDKPLGVTVLNVTHYTAAVEWRVQSIVYTPETYHVLYGKDELSLNQTSATVYGSDDITGENMKFSIALTGLEAESTYYFTVIAANSFSTTKSVMKSFFTIPTRKYSPIMMIMNFTLL